MPPMRRVPRIIWALGILTLLCALAVVGGTLGGQQLTARAQADLSAGRARWQSRPVARYQLVVDRDHNWSGPCRQVAEVRNEVVVAVAENSCPGDPPTVTGLFGAIADDLAQLEGACGPNGCGCDGVWRVRATYDAQGGHPTQVRVAVNEAERHRYFWEPLLAGGCTLVGWGNRDVRVTLTPLP